MTKNEIHLSNQSNQALGLANYAKSFLIEGTASAEVKARTIRFFLDATLCGLSATALGTNAPTVLRNLALSHRTTEHSLKPGKATQAGATIFGSSELVDPVWATRFGSAAVREWDSNGTNFGYDPERGNVAGEFGHNDFYPAVVAAAQMAGADGETLLKGLILVDTIRGRLAEVFSLKTYKIDHVLHGGIAVAATCGALLSATSEQIESAIGMVVAHHVPFRAIRAGHQLSDSKGASAAITAASAFECVLMSIQGFQGPKDIFRNPEAIFRLFEGPGQMFAAVKAGKLAGKINSEQLDASPFDLHMPMDGSDFPIMGMHIKLALYEHQSAGAVDAVIRLLEANPELCQADAIKAIKVLAYEPAFGIIGDPAKRDPHTRQSADHSMVYIIATLLRKAEELGHSNWLELMLEPADYSPAAVHNSRTRELMQLISFEHGGPDYDAKYPEGIPTSVQITDQNGEIFDSGMVMFPPGHARYEGNDFAVLFARKCEIMAGHAFPNPKDAALVIKALSSIDQLDPQGVSEIYDFGTPITFADKPFDE